MQPQTRQRLADANPADRALRLALPRHLARGSRVLDVGCGDGIGARHVAACAPGPVSYTGLDPDARACAAARDTLRQLAGAFADARVLGGSFHEFAVSGSDRFDLLLFLRALHECVDGHEPGSLFSLAAATAARTRAGGRVLVSDPVLEAELPLPEQARIAAFDARVAPPSGGRPHLAAAAIEHAFVAAGLRVIERSESARFALGAYLGVGGARQLLIVFERPAH